MKLVYVDNNRPITDSLIIAETFNKRHADVLRSIETMECSPEFTERNFALSHYIDSTGRKLPKYLITHDGFSFLAMGYTGKEAARFKEMYINEFNLMKEQHNKPTHTLPQSYSEALRLAADLSDKTIALEAKIEADRPMLVFAESLQVSTDSILIGQLAKLLKQNGIDIGQNRLFQVLRQDGYLMTRGDQYNMPTQRSMDMKLMEIKVGTRSSVSEGTKTTQTTKVTGKGIAYFINKFKDIAKTA